MTTTTKDITDLVDLRCSSIHFLELDRLLQKLDNEDLDVLYSILRHIEIVEYELEQEYRRGYDDGYDKGYGDGTSTEE